VFPFIGMSQFGFEITNMSYLLKKICLGTSQVKWAQLRYKEVVTTPDDFSLVEVKSCTHYMTFVNVKFVRVKGDFNFN